MMDQNLPLQLQQSTTVLDPAYPFLEDARQLMLSRKKKKWNTKVSRDGVIRETMTVTMEREYVPLGYARIFKNSEVLGKLSPQACKILIHIGCTLHIDHQKVKLSAKDSGLERRAFSKAVAELIDARVLAKEKREHYWVNVAIIVVGTDPEMPNGYDQIKSE